MSEARFSRRAFLSSGTAGAIASIAAGAADPLPRELVPLVEKIEPYFTDPDKFGDVSRGNPVPHRLTEKKREEVGLTRDTWTLQIINDREHPATIDHERTDENEMSFTFTNLLKTSQGRSVRFAKVMTCLNIGCPLGMGIWEGLPLRNLIWLTKPTANLRRVFYYGYHNDDPKQMFKSSLPIGRILEDYDDLPPVILCYKLNGEFLSPERGGPVRLLVPEHYGFKSVKWLTHIVLSNLPHANDTYGAQNNDVDSPLKTFAATLPFPTDVKANAPIPVIGYAQVGVSGLSKVQVWVSPAGEKWDADDTHFTKAPWVDARILPPPAKWGGNLPGGKIPKDTIGFDENGRPKTWPMKLAKAHWAALLPGLPAGQYTLRCRTIDAKGIAQPMPRPFKKSGRCDIESVKITVS
jgi:DMSO/TMAO reductase YedYZ molybdopterin-dependent catalytic subunit